MQRYPLVFVLTLTCLPAQNIVSTGKACGTKGTELSVYGSPSPGQSVELRITKMAPTLHQVILGLDNKSWALGKLPWPVPVSWGFATGCSLYVRPDFLLPLPANSQGEVLVSITTAASLVGQSFHLQVVALPASGSAYMTRAVTINIGNGAAAAVAGTVKERSSGKGIAGARVTLFTPGLTFFRETRTDVAGSYSFAVVPRGLFRLGVAARGWDYAE